jgi:hypothetical protein
MEVRGTFMFLEKKGGETVTLNAFGDIKWESLDYINGKETLMALAALDRGVDEANRGDILLLMVDNTTAQAVINAKCIYLGTMH